MEGSRVEKSCVRWGRALSEFPQYNCLVKLGTTQEKRFMVDLMCLRQAYERHEIMEVKWINGGNNPADAMTKARLCQALKTLIDINKLNL